MRFVLSAILSVCLLFGSVPMAYAVESGGSDDVIISSDSFNGDEYSDSDSSVSSDSSPDNTLLIYLDDSGNVIYNGDHVINTSVSVDSWSEYSNGAYYDITYYSSSASTLAFESDDIAFGTLMRALGFNVSSGGGAFESGYVGWKVVEPNNYQYGFLTLLLSIEDNISNIESDVLNIEDIVTYYFPNLYQYVTYIYSYIPSMQTYIVYLYRAVANYTNDYLSTIADEISTLSTISGQVGATNNLITAGFSDVIEGFDTYFNQYSTSNLYRFVMQISSNVEDVGRIIDDWAVDIYDAIVEIDSVLGSTNNLVTSGFSNLRTLVEEIQDILDSSNGQLVTINSTLSTISSQIGSTNNLITAGFSDLIEAIENISISFSFGDSDSGSDSGSSSGSAWVDLLETLIESLGEVIETFLETVIGGFFSVLELLIGEFDFASISASLEDLSLSYSNSFPFGVISMIANALSVLSADPQAPIITWDVAGETITLDLSEFDGVATACRYFLLVLYCIGLYKCTNEWVFGGSS